MKGITFKKMGQHTYNQTASLWFIHLHKQLFCLFIKEKEIPERCEAFKKQSR